MKTPEDEAFDDLAQRQGAWGGGFQAKRRMAADKLQEPIYNITVFDNAHPKGIPLEDWVQPAQSIKVEGLLHVVCQCDKCKALPVQEPVAWVDLLKEAQQIVKSKFLWKKFIDGTPLANDIAGWMADFAQQYTAPVQEPVAELRRLHEVNEDLLKAMRQLACLGNGDRYGNSYGNVIAQLALNKATGETE